MKASADGTVAFAVAWMARRGVRRSGGPPRARGDTAGNRRAGPDVLRSVVDGLGRPVPAVTVKSSRPNRTGTGRRPWRSPPDRRRRPVFPGAIPPAPIGPLAPVRRRMAMAHIGTRPRSRSTSIVMSRKVGLGRGLRCSRTGRRRARPRRAGGPRVGGMGDMRRRQTPRLPLQASGPIPARAPAVGPRPSRRSHSPRLARPS